MGKSLNQVTIMGNLTRDPELRDTPNGQKVGNISLALNRSYKDSSGEWQEATDYIDVVMWGSLAERVATYLFKGRRALIQGTLQSRSWEQDGQKRSKVEVLARDVIFIDQREKEEVTDASGYEQAKAQADKLKAKQQVDEVYDVPEEEIDLSSIPF
jgi:single-strand DNA-binding protein